MATSNEARVRIRAYNVGFGDCLLVRIPGSERALWMLVDFGNAPGKGGSNVVFPAIAEDIFEETKGRLDVLVVTHEHLDHMEGFYSQRKMFDRMQVDHVWMGLPSRPDYYQKYPDARVHKRLTSMAPRLLKSFQGRGLQLTDGFERMLRNNLSNKDRLDYVRGLGSIHYLARRTGMRGKGLKGVKVRVLAPERDVSVYYKSPAMSHAMGLVRSADGASTRTGSALDFPKAKRLPGGANPGNLSSTDWTDLRTRIRTGGVEVVRAIDRAQNNTSLVFELTVGGKRLIFPGDAELESWHVMADETDLQPVDFLKVSHHGSHNGTPRDRLDTLLPKARKDKARILVSTRSKVYGTKNPVPDADLLKELKRRGKVTTTDGSASLYRDVYV